MEKEKRPPLDNKQETISLSTVSVNTVSTPPPVLQRANLIEFLFGDELSAKRCICYIYGLFSICIIFGAIILLAIHPIKKPDYKAYVPAIPDRIDSFHTK